MLFALGAVLLAAAGPPDWVATAGRSLRHSSDRYLTAYAFADGPDALATAKLNAAAELAKLLSVRIEAQLTELSEASNGSERQQLTALNKSSTDVRLDGIAYETFNDGARVHALAILERGHASAERRKHRDEAVAKVRESIRLAQLAEQEKREGDAVIGYLAARRLAGEALQDETIARVIARGDDEGWPKLEAELGTSTRSCNEQIEGLLRSPHATLPEAATALALQLRAQGIKSAKWSIAPFTWRASIYPSLFGRAAASELESALAKLSAGDPPGAAELAFKGTYTDEAASVRIIVTAREVSSGRTVASAESTLPKKAISADLLLTPTNLIAAMRDEKILGAGEAVPGGLRVELFTNKPVSAGESALFTAGDELKLFVRVNKPCYVRLVYLLQSGLKVPIAQAWFINEANVNKLVEFTDAFEIAAPFGTEHIQAAAFTEKPEPLPTKKFTVEGSEYDALEDGTLALVKHRGFKRKSAAAESADTFVTLTSMPKRD